MMERYVICRKFGAEVHLTAGAAGGEMVENMFAHLQARLQPHDYVHACMQL